MINESAILGASIIAAFLSGMVALFAPCCVSVLLPTYLASVFRDRKKVMRMTFVYFAGISATLLPIGLGVSALASVFSKWHSQMYIIGGAFMLILGLMSFIGKNIPMFPSMKTKVDWHPKSVFLLGVLSGAATSCCAPVLAGAVTLAVLSASFIKAIIVVFAYIFGMTFPLFIIAYFYDRYNLADARIVKGKLLEWKIGKGVVSVHSTNLIATIVFLFMGSAFLYLGLTGDAYWAPSWQVQIGNALNKWSNQMAVYLMAVPDVVWGILVIGLFAYFAYNIVKSNKGRS